MKGVLSKIKGTNDMYKVSKWVLGTVREASNKFQEAEATAMEVDGGEGLTVNAVQV